VTKEDAIAMLIKIGSTPSKTKENYLILISDLSFE
jgi:hypothetical protein